MKQDVQGDTKKFVPNDYIGVHFVYLPYKDVIRSWGDQRCLLTYEFIEDHRLVCNSRYDTITIGSRASLKVWRKSIQWPDKRLNTTRELVRWGWIVNLHWVKVSEYQQGIDIISDPRFCHVRLVVQTISCLLSWWLTIERTLKLITVNGGISFGRLGSDSEIGLILLGSRAVTSSLHQET